MLRIYLWVNALLYIVFAVWCTLLWQRTAQHLGYVEFTNAGNSEYLVVYGGLQLGMGLFFAISALKPTLHQAGLLFAVLLYSCIVVYRLITVIVFSPVAPITLAIAALEGVLLMVALWLFFTKRDATLR